MKNNFGSFRVSDLFDVISPQSFDAGAIPMVKTNKDSNFWVPFIGRMSRHNGRQGYYLRNDTDSSELRWFFGAWDDLDQSSISISQIGEQKAYYQPNAWMGSQNMFCLRPKVQNGHSLFKLDLYLGLYFVTLFNCQLRNYSSGYDSYPTKSDIISWRVKLPVTPSGSPDWQYMETYIKNLEASYIKKLESYLQVLGYSMIDDCKLTSDDKKILKGPDKWGKFRVGDLFRIKPTKWYHLNNDALFVADGKNPVVTNSESGNGITGYTNLECNMLGNMITYSDTTSENSIFYQPNPFVGYSHVQGLYPIGKHNWSRNELLYFVASFRKASEGRYNYGSKFNRQKAMAENVELPITNSGQPDYDFMDSYIKAIEKLKVLKLKKFLDKKVSLYNMVVSKQQ